MTKDEPMAPSGRSFLGSGMSMAAYGLLLLSSVALFVLWGGPLWRVTHTDSNVMRFVVSYSSVIPLAAIILLAVKRFSWTHLLTAVGTVWAFKLLLTAPLYYALAPGGALEDIGAIAPKRGVPTASATTDAAKAPTGYVAADGAFDSGSIRGKVTQAGAPAVGAVVYLEDPVPGLPVGASETKTLVMTDEGYDRRLYFARTIDHLVIRNDAAAMNNAHVRGPKASLLNAPVPPGTTTQPLALEDPNLYTVQSDTAPNLRAALLVIDHPYATRVDDAGSFTLDKVPAAETRIVALWVDGEGMVQRAERSAKVTSGAELRVDLPIGGANAPPTNTETK